MNSFSKTILFLTLTFFVLNGRVSAQTDSVDVNINFFGREFQSFDSRPYRTGWVYWMPWQFYNQVMIETGNTRDSSVQRLVREMKNFNVFLVCGGTINPSTKMTLYSNEKVIRDSLKLTINDSIVLRPIDMENMSEEAAFILLRLEQGGMKSLMGSMGLQPYFFIFPNLDSKGKPYIDASKPGKMKLSWDSGFYHRWALPLDVLSSPKFCPVDDEKFGGKYIYCPHHGNKLESQPKK